MNLIPLSRYKIVGHSMEPIFREGEVVWVNNWAYLFSKPRVGDLIIFDFNKRKLVKRIIEIKKEHLLVMGDNLRDSLDSRKFGEIEFKQVKGKVLLRKSQGVYI